jgi:hypothetical protein
MRSAARVVKTRRGLRLVEAGTVVSEVLAKPGPTHTMFDVLAATVAALAPGPRVALLGFAAGGIVAPLRAMGFAHPLDAVDLSLDGARVFRRLGARWCGPLEVARGDASTWLRARRSRFDCIVEDLFRDGPTGMAKPEICGTMLPRLLRQRLSARGIAITNTLPVRGVSWPRVFAPLAAPFAEAYVVVLADYDNRFLVAGRALGGAARVSARIRRALRAIGSRQARRFRVRNLSGRVRTARNRSGRP